MDILETEKGEEFMRELTALSLKYGVVITGCGCCSSPYCRELGSQESGEYAYSPEMGDPGLSWVELKP